MSHDARNESAAVLRELLDPHAIDAQPEPRTPEDVAQTTVAVDRILGNLGLGDSESSVD